MKKVIFIYNPLSGDRSIQVKIDYIVKQFTKNNILIQAYPILNDEGERLAAIFEQEEYTYAVISGGDGTINYVVNTMLNNAVNIPIGIISSGTCNDFARSLNISGDLKKSIDIILKGKTVDTDVGLINNDRYFLSTCAGGVFVDVSFNTSVELKKSIGPLAYYLKAFTEVKSKKPFKLKIKTDTETMEQNVLLFLILNGKHAAGFNNIDIEADISDGLMDMIIIKDCAHIDLAAMFFKALSNDFLKDKNVLKLRTSTCVIEGNKNIPVSIDGEKGDGLPMTVEFINKALKVFVK